MPRCRHKAQPPDVRLPGQPSSPRAPCESRQGEGRQLLFLLQTSISGLRGKRAPDATAAPGVSLNRWTDHRQGAAGFSREGTGGGQHPRGQASSASPSPKPETQVSSPERGPGGRQGPGPGGEAGSSWKLPQAQKNPRSARFFLPELERPHFPPGPPFSLHSGQFRCILQRPPVGGVFQFPVLSQAEPWEGRPGRPRPWLAGSV